MVNQIILTSEDDYNDITKYIRERHVQKVFLVCGRSMDRMDIGKYWQRLSEGNDVEVVRFSDYKPNPEYESVQKGVVLFRQEKCDMIVAVGGGSALDVAKCIKLFSNMDQDRNYLEQVIVPNNIPFLVMPTTAGTGSEATRFAVIYYAGEKQSVSDYSCIPDAVLFDPSCLRSLPLYHKKSAMMDALCHSMESMWSVNATDGSMDYSEAAIRSIISCYQDYLNGDERAADEMLYAANIAGKAINITQTTAGHAMCYKLTGLYGFAHGHAAVLCVSVLFPFMTDHLDYCTDPRGTSHLEMAFKRITKAFGCGSFSECSGKLTDMIDSLGLEKPLIGDENLDILVRTVNPVRLKNNPVALGSEDIKLLYKKISR